MVDDIGRVMPGTLRVKTWLMAQAWAGSAGDDDVAQW